MQVSSESGWSPDPEFFAKRQYKKTEWGWFPVEDAFGGGECPQHNAKYCQWTKLRPKEESNLQALVFVVMVYLAYSNHPSHLFTFSLPLPQLVSLLLEENGP